MKSLVWFRGDLRLDDNPALRNACENSEEVSAVFLFSPKQLSLHSEANIKVDFLLKNLVLLEKKLNDLNICLTIIESEGFSFDKGYISNLAAKNNIDKVFWNNQFGEDELHRDLQVSEALASNKINYEFFDDQVVYKPGTLKTGQGNPYSVFTPFKR